MAAVVPRLGGAEHSMPYVSYVSADPADPARQLAGHVRMA